MATNLHPVLNRLYTAIVHFSNFTNGNHASFSYYTVQCSVATWAITETSKDTIPAFCLESDGVFYSVTRAIFDYRSTLLNTQSAKDGLNINNRAADQIAEETVFNVSQTTTDQTSLALEMPVDAYDTFTAKQEAVLRAQVGDVNQRECNNDLTAQSCSSLAIEEHGDQPNHSANLCPAVAKPSSTQDVAHKVDALTNSLVLGEQSTRVASWPDISDCTTNLTPSPCRPEHHWLYCRMGLVAVLVASAAALAYMHYHRKAKREGSRRAAHGVVLAFEKSPESGRQN